MTEMVIFPSGDAWHVEHVGDRTVFDLFGSTVLPTPFTVDVPAERVVGELERLNPGVHVDWFGSHAEWEAEVLRGEPDDAYMAGVQAAVLPETA